MNANKDSSNLLSVAFTQATVKTICSKHSGSILAQNEPQVQLSVHNTEKALEVFRANLTTSELTSEAVGGKLIARPAKIYDLLLNCGLVSSSFDKDVVMEVIARLYKGPSEIDEKAFIKFLESFQAPAYNYGQRLRRNAGRGELRDVTDLIIRGCDVNTADGEGLTSLHYACEFNRADIVSALKMLVGEALMVNTKDKYGWGPLHCAIHHGSEECAKLLLEFGATVALRDHVGKTPLHFAAARNRLSLCDLLIAAGADLNDTDDHGMTPMHDAAFKGHSKVYQTLLKSSTNKPFDIGIRDKLGYLASDYLGNYQYEFPPDLPSTK